MRGSPNERARPSKRNAPGVQGGGERQPDSLLCWAPAEEDETDASLRKSDARPPR